MQKNRDEIVTAIAIATSTSALLALFLFILPIAQLKTVKELFGWLLVLSTYLLIKAAYTFIHKIPSASDISE